MAKTTRSSLLLVNLSLFDIFLSSISATCTFPASPDSSSSSPHNVKGLFVFGSSYVDNGNNNFIQNNFAKANYTPYGIDFPLGPSGRFTNGKNTVDLLGDELDLPSYIPVFTNPDTKGVKIVHGVNFASGASGILDDTNSILGVINLKQQIKNFEEVTLKELEEQVGCRSNESLPNYLFLLGTGGNDYTSNFFVAKASNVTLKAFTANLTTSFTVQIQGKYSYMEISWQKLYNLGARKFVLMSLYPIGCNPYNIAAQPGKKRCVKMYNKAARHFNTRLRSLVDKMKQHMPGSIPVYVNAYDVILDIIQNPSPKGFKDTSTTCCEGKLSCKSGGSVCSNRNTHVYFDGVHPTEAVNELIAKSAFSSNLTTQVYPINIKQLAECSKFLGNTLV